MKKALAAHTPRRHVRSSFEVFSIATFALTFGCACVATFVLVALGAPQLVATQPRSIVDRRVVSAHAPPKADVSSIR
jgi:hypothetical protein